MIHRRLGRTELSVSLAGLGTGGPSQFGQTDKLAAAEQARLLRAALDLGVNVIDTAMAYGQSEEMLGEALHGIARDRYTLCTKLSPTRVARETYATTPPGDRPTDLVSADETVALCEASLRRLRLETIDVYQVHGVTLDLYPTVVERIYPALVRLREAGKIRFIGITERFFQDPAHTMLQTAVPSGLWDTVMLKYGILNQAAEPLLARCLADGVGVLNMAPVRVKLTRANELAALLAEWRTRGLVAADALPTDDPLGWLVHGHVDSVIAAGYKFAAEPRGVSTVLTGTAHLDHLQANVAALIGQPLPPTDSARLRAALGHLAEAA